MIRLTTILESTLAQDSPGTHLTRGKLLRTQVIARDSQRQRQVQDLSFTHNDVIRVSDVISARQSRR